MPVIPVLRDYLLTRRSVGQAFLAAPGPEGVELETLLTIATRVPDHGKLTPWRLVLYTGAARQAAGAALARLIQARRPDIDAASLDIERGQFLPAPLVVGVLFSPQKSATIPQFEQLISAGNVAFNLVHGAHALGYGAQWVTRWYATDAEAAPLLGAGPDEHFVGFVHIGTATTTMQDRARPDLTQIVSHWQDLSPRDD